MTDFSFDDLALTLIRGDRNNPPLVFSFNQLKAGIFPAGLTELQAETLAFCHGWISGKENFNVTTSGSTGIPKQITLHRSSMQASALATVTTVGLRRSDTALVCLDTRYIAGKMMIVRSLVVGMNMVVVEPAANPFSMLDDDLKIDFTALVPYQALATLNSPADERKLNRLSVILVGGAVIDRSLLHLLQGCAPAIFATYGMTETISHVALQKLNPPKEQDYFQALPGVHLTTDDRNCLVINAGYLGQDDIVTNDIVELFSPDRFRWIGRWDNVINTGGIKVFPEKIEKIIADVFEEFQITNRFFITGIEDERFGNAVTLIVEGTIMRASESEVLEAISKKLTRFELPRSVRYIKKFIETDTGKIQRKLTTEKAAMRTE